MPNPDVSWDKIIGLDGAKDTFAHMGRLISQALNPVLRAYQQGKTQLPTAVLLYGPPGTGKTLLANALAAETDRLFYRVSCADMLSAHYGVSEKNVRELFDSALEAEKDSVILIDEAEQLLGRRDDDRHEASSRVTAEFLQCLDRVKSQEKPGHVIVVAATNLPYKLDPAYWRRFPHRFECPLPDEPARRRLLELFLDNWPHTLTAQDLDDLAARTDKYAGSNFQNVCTGAIEDAQDRTVNATHWRCHIDETDGSQRWLPCHPGDEGAREVTCDALGTELFGREWQAWQQGKKLPDEVVAKLQRAVGVWPVTRESIEVALAKNKPTVSEEYLGKCRRFTEEMGRSGAERL